MQVRLPMLEDSFRRLTAAVRRAIRWVIPPAVLVADDDETVRTLCVAALTRAGFVTDVAVNGREALEKIRKYSYSAVLLDLGMPYLHGATVLALVERELPELMQRLIVITGASDTALIDFRQRVGAILRKPVTVETIIATVRTCCGAYPMDETRRNVA